MHQTSDSRNHIVTEVRLTIGQCKLIGRLLDEKLYEVECGTSDFNEKPLQTLIDLFYMVSAETAEEKAINEPKRAAKFRAWL